MKTDHTCTTKSSSCRLSSGTEASSPSIRVVAERVRPREIQNVNSAARIRNINHGNRRRRAAILCIPKLLISKLLRSAPESLCRLHTTVDDGRRLSIKTRVKIKLSRRQHRRASRRRNTVK